MAKTSLWRVPYDHFGTLTNYRTGRPQVGDYLVQVGGPIAVGAISGLAGARLKDVSGAVAGVSIVAGLLFSMAIFLFQLRMTLPNDKRLGQQDLDLIDQCMKNVLWAILLGLSLSLYLVIGGAGGWLSAGWLGRLLTGLAIAAAAHFLLVLAMCLKRLRRAYERLGMKTP